MPALAMIFRLAFLALGLGITVPGAAADCRVQDPELQGQYSGPCVDGLAQGVGTASGSARYTGDFVAGRKHGSGRKEWPNGDRYEGGFLNDLKHGYGLYVWGRGSGWAGQRYAGSFDHDRRQGAGVYEWPDGRQLAGHWQDDLPPMVLLPAMQTTARMYAEKIVAVSRPGVNVCRNVAVGTVEIDTISGEVQAVEGERIRVRIVRTGRFSNDLDGRTIAPGSEIRDLAENWFPCR